MLGAFGMGAAGLVACGTASSTSSSGTTASAPSTGTSSTASAAATESAGTATEEIPEETAGPYPGDGSNGPDVLSQSGIVRSDIWSSFGSASGTAAGVPMTLAITNLATSVPFTGVAVYVWHCDREGRCSLYSSGVTEENYLRGVQIADATANCWRNRSVNRSSPLYSLTTAAGTTVGPFSPGSCPASPRGPSGRRMNGWGCGW